MWTKESIKLAARAIHEGLVANERIIDKLREENLVLSEVLNNFSEMKKKFTSDDETF